MQTSAVVSVTVNVDQYEDIPDTPVQKRTITELHRDQKECITQVYDHIRNNIHRILVVAICGTGKTVMAGWIIRDATQRAKKPMRCLFLVPLTCLISQAYEEFEALGVPATILQSDRKFDKSADVIIASLDTVGSRLKKQSVVELFGEGIGVVFVDEAHYSSYRTATIAVHDHYIKTGAVIIGLTATPWRTKRTEYLGEWFDVTVEAPQAPDLVKTGRAVPSRIFGFDNTFDLSSLDIGNDGDYRADQIAAQGKTRAALSCVVREYKRLASDRITIAFCATVDHAIALTNAFNEAGIPSDYVVGNTKDNERSEKYKALKSGAIKVLTSVGCLNTGFNIRKISAVLFVRPTRSKALWHQSAGRAARTYPGKKDYFVLDFGSNAVRLGSPSSYQNNDISERAWKNKAELSLKRCPRCEEIIPAFTRVCLCGYEFLSIENDFGANVDQELTEILIGIDKEKAKFLRKQKRLCYKENISPEIASQRFLEEYGHIPADDWHIYSVLGKHPSKKAKEAFTKYLEKFAKRKYHVYWLKHHLRLEFGSPEQQRHYKQQDEKRHRERQKQKQREEWAKNAAGAGTAGNSNNDEKDNTSQDEDEPKVKIPSTCFDKQWWEILNVPAIPESHEQVKRAYHALANLYHPDRSTLPNATSTMQGINNAYDEYREIKDTLFTMSEEDTQGSEVTMEEVETEGNSL